ncbi:MAG: DUF3159 domain-containing protein [Geodermatophilaceae bacterium]|nr:DUF3159 domain-containing protein [Geodermatophilaceae bacterium]MDQ3465802.1 DUF3159 domain-containing protein [Actinomycetota bacterium]
MSERNEPAVEQVSEPVQPVPPDAADRRRQLFIDSFGGVRGVIDSALPVVVFVVANTLGGLDVAVWSAVAVGICLVVLRLIRKQSVQQAFSGFFGIAIAAFIAKQTGEAKGYFLLGIWGSLAYTALFALSAAIRRPIIGLIWEWISPSPRPWRTQPPLMRVYTATTLLWAAVFLSRFLVQNSLYDADQTGWLAAARLAMGYPLTIALLAITVFWVRRVRHREEETAPIAPGAAAAGTASGGKPPL